MIPDFVPHWCNSRAVKILHVPVTFRVVSSDVKFLTGNDLAHLLEEPPHEVAAIVG